MEEVAQRMQEMMQGQQMLVERLAHIQRENEQMRIRNEELTRGTFQQMPVILNALAELPQALRGRCTEIGSIHC